jgi:ABC-type thiamin/hydroxymethylpyrimidine transport system permease subunit
MKERFLSQEISCMNKEYVFGILFFSGLWGISEATLGGALYTANIRYASVPLTIIGFIILTFARIYFPQRGTATLIASLAMLYKFLNEPFFACHLLGIFLIGLCYDVVFDVFKIKNRSLRAVLATYLSYAMFALMLTYVFRYNYWVQGGLGRVLEHVAIAGTMAAAGGAVFVPLSFHFGQQLKTKFAMPFRLRFQCGSVTAKGLGDGSAISIPKLPLILTTALWAFGITMYFFS